MVILWERFVTLKKCFIQKIQGPPDFFLSTVKTVENTSKGQAEATTQHTGSGGKEQTQRSERTIHASKEKEGNWQPEEDRILSGEKQLSQKQNKTKNFSSCFNLYFWRTDRHFEFLGGWRGA